jgi:predicted ATP-binding protein involved in virulence
MSESAAAAKDALLGRITVLDARPWEVEEPDTAPQVRAMLESSRKVVNGAWEEANKKVEIALLAQVGRGKSTLVAAAASLHLENTTGAPSKWSVLRVGAGRVTLGEWVVRFEERGDIEVSVTSWWEKDELRRELRLYAEDIWLQLFPRGQDQLPAGTAGQELKRLLTNWTAPGAARQDALKDRARAIADACTAAERGLDEGLKQFAAEVVEMAGLESRGEGIPRAFSRDPAGLLELQKHLSSLNEGIDSSVLAPRATVVTVPAEMGPGRVDALVDTQGLDSSGRGTLFAGRSDIQARLDDLSVPIVVCSTFEDAPDLGSLGLLKQLLRPDAAPDAQRRGRLTLVLIDRGAYDEDEDGAQAREADRNRKVVECRDVLRAELGERAAAVEVRVVDARRKADVEEWKECLRQIAEDERAARRERWDAVEGSVALSLQPLEERQKLDRLRHLDLQLLWRWEAGMAQRRAEPVHPVALLAAAVRGKESQDYAHWSHLNAAARRDGVYEKLDLAALAARLWVDRAMPRLAFLDTLRGSQRGVRWLDGQDDVGRAHVRMRAVGVQLVWAVASIRAREALAADLRRWFRSDAVKPIWGRLRARWGQGAGYVDDFALELDGLARSSPEREQPQLSPPDIEGMLSQGARQMALQRVHLQGFRAFKDLRFDTSGFNVLVGDNGHGKTSALIAIAHLLSPLVAGLVGGQASDMVVMDARRESFAGLGPGGDTLAPPEPLRIEVVAQFEGAPLQWAREAEVVIGADGEKLVERTLPDGPARRAQDLRDELGAPTDRKLPLFAAYFRDRDDIDSFRFDPDLIVKDYRLDGYRSWFHASSDFQLFLTWMRKQTYAAVQQGRANRLLRGIERAVRTCVPNVEQFHYNIKEERLEVRWSNGAVAPSSTMSDGYRSMLALVADLAWRACVLNPQLMEFAPELTEGVVLIDEVDLHLHPKWQRRVLGDLRRAFPRLQFIVSTHSPQVISSVDPTEVRILRADGAVRTVTHTLGRDSNSLLESVFGETAHPAWVYEQVEAAQRAMQAGELDRASTLIDALEAKLDASATLVRSLRWQLLEDFAPEEE